MTPDIRTQLQHILQLVTAGQLTEARTRILGLAVHDCQDPADLELMGQLYDKLGDSLNAIQCYQRLVQAGQAGNPALLVKLAHAYMGADQPQQASETLNAAFRIEPERGETHAAAGRLCLLQKDYDQAVAWLQRALERMPAADAVVLGNLGSALSNLGQYERALEYLQASLALEPNHAQLHILVASACIELGRMDEAIASCERALALQPHSGEAYERLAFARKFTAADQGTIQAAEAVLSAPLPIDERAALHFAIGKMKDDTGEHDAAFEHFRQGNLLSRQTDVPDIRYPYLQREQDLCTRGVLAAARELPPSPSRVPVFIVGMPRSGSTLIEQILSSHPAVAAAGEIGNMLATCDSLLAGVQEKRHWWSNVALPEHDTLAHLATSYLQALRAGREDAQRVTDKMLDNYLCLGVIALLFPHARIIHAVRHPLDSCLSSYFLHFHQLPWTASLDWIAMRYRYYRTAMAHWHQVLPPGMLLDVHYETVVAETEQQARRIIEHVDLPWDPACLSFFNSDRSVRTASAWQVRQPIYQSSKQRWVRYAAHIQPLVDALADYLQDDRAALEQHGLHLARPKKRFW